MDPRSRCRYRLGDEDVLTGDFLDHKRPTSARPAPNRSKIAFVIEARSEDPVEVCRDCELKLYCHCDNL